MVGDDFPKRLEQMEHAQMNVNRLEEAARGLVASDKGLLAMDESSELHYARPSITTNPPVTMRTMALSLSQFLKSKRSLLASRKQDDGKQAQP
jgi:hypothetical protein